MIRRNISVAIVALLLSPLGWSSPIHSHCLVLPWSIESTFGATGVVVTNPVPTTSLFGIPLFQGVPPGTEACSYELSDLTSVDITLTFTNSGLFANAGGIRVSAGGAPFMNSAFPLTNNGGAFDTSNIPLTSGLKRTFSFVPHSGSTGQQYVGGDPPAGLGTPTGFVFPVPYLDINFYSALMTAVDFEAVAITAGTVVAHGNHYYIPEASTLALSLAVLSAVSLTRQR